MMKTDNVWVEIEEYDDETDEYTNLEASRLKIGAFPESGQAEHLVGKLDELAACIVETTLAQEPLAPDNENDDR